MTDLEREKAQKEISAWQHELRVDESYVIIPVWFCGDEIKVILGLN